MAVLDNYLNPGQGASYATDDPVAAYNQLYAQGVGQQSQDALNALNRYLPALARASQIRGQRDKSQQYLDQGMEQLQNIGTSGGLNSAEWSNVANLLAGGMPQSGNMAGLQVIGNPLAAMATNNANSADIQNKYQVQRGMALAKLGAPEALNQMAQDATNYNQPLIVNAMANAGGAAALRNAAINEQSVPADVALRQSQLAQEQGLAPTGQNINFNTATGQKVGYGVGGTPRGGYINNSPMNPAERTLNSDQEQQQLNQYTSLAAQNNPEIIQARQQAIQDSLNDLNNQASKSGDSFVKGIYTVDPTSMQNIKAAQITQGKLQDIQQMAGIPVPVKSALATLQQIQDIPGYDTVVKNTIDTLNNTGQINVAALQSQLEGAGAKFQQTASIAPVVADNISGIRSNGNAGRADVSRIQQDAIDKGYATPIDADYYTPIINAAISGTPIPDKIKQRADGAAGYAGDAIKSAINSSSRAQVVNNVQNYLTQQYREQGITNKDPKKDAVQFVNRALNYGGMQ